MTNHPNRRRLPFRVRYAEHEAAFSDKAEACRFAKWVGTAEVVATHGDDRGVIGRYEGGALVPDAVASA